MRSLLSLAVAIALVGCQPEVVTVWGRCSDGGVWLADAANPVVPVFEAGRPAQQTVSFRRCDRDDVCNANEICDRRFPGGMCTKPCQTDAVCGWNGLCSQSVCLRRCAQNETICADLGAACSALVATDGARRACRPSCANAGPTCGARQVCNTATSECSFGSDQAVVGQSCDRGCPGTCLREGPWGSFAGGYCSVFVRYDQGSPLAAGAPLPQGACPAGAVMIPDDGDGPGDGVYCYKRCDDDTSCRAGYRCAKRFAWLSNDPFSTGACVPAQP